MPRNETVHSPLVSKSVGSIIVGIWDKAVVKLGPPFRFSVGKPAGG